jgi:hypothetical protein
MTDGVIKNTKDSRLLKSPAASIPSTFDAFRSLLTGTGIPVDLLINEAGWTTLGTALAKAALLKDVTAQKCGLDPGDDPTVDDAIFAIAPPPGRLVQSVQADLGPDYLLANGAFYDTTQYPELGSVDPKAGTWRQIKETTTNNVASSATNIVYFNGYWYFATSHSTAYLRVWRTNDIAGTWTYTQVYSGSSSPQRLKVLNNTLVLLVEIGTTDKTWFSTNGTSWTEGSAIGTYTDANGFDITWDGTRYVAAMSSGETQVRYATSLSGTWSGFTITGYRTGSAVLSILYAGGYYVISQYDSSANYTYVQYRSGWGTSGWTTSAGVYARFENLYYINSKFIAVGGRVGSVNKVALYYATTPASWTRVVLPTDTLYSDYNVYLTFDGTTYSIFGLTGSSESSAWSSMTLESSWVRTTSTLNIGSSSVKVALVNGVYATIYCDSSYYNIYLYYSGSPEGSFKKLPTQTVTDAYCFIKAR